MNLRPYQTALLDAIATAREAGQNRLLLRAATGTGKTVSFAHLLKHDQLRAWLETFPVNQRKMLIIAHREELLEQAAAKITSANPGVMVGIEQGDRRANRYSDVVVASIQTLTAMGCRRLLELLRHHTFRVVVYDECHHASSPTARTALVHLGFLPPADASTESSLEAPSYDDVEKMSKALQGWDDVAPKDRLLVGFTATPNRSDGVGLSCVFQTIAFSYPLREAIQDGWLVPITPWVVDSTVTLDTVRTNRGDFNQRELADAVNNRERNLLALHAWRQYAEGRPTLAFTVDVAHAHDLADTFREAGIRAQAISGETPKEERRETLAAFSSGELDIITNCMILTEGTDLPRTSCILHAKPTKSATLYEQMTGRGLRLFEGKQDCIVIDIVDIARKHSLMAAPVLYGLPPGLKSEQGKNLDEMADLFDLFVGKHPGFAADKLGKVSIERLAVQATTFDIWEIPSLGAFAAGRALNWVKTGVDTFRLQYPWQDGVEVVEVAPDLLGQFAVSCTLRPAVGPTRQRTIAAALKTADEAATVAEAFVQTERQSVTRLTDKAAGWRGVPASTKQIKFLQWKRIPIKPGLTKGEAADLITLYRTRSGQ